MPGGYLKIDYYKPTRRFNRRGRIEALGGLPVLSPPLPLCHPRVGGGPGQSEIAGVLTLVNHSKRSVDSIALPNAILLH